MTTKKKKVFIDLFSMSLSSNLQRVVSFFVFLLIMKELSVHDYGVLTLLFTVPGPFLLFSSFGVGTLISSEIAKFRSRDDDSYISRLFFEFNIIRFVIFFVLLFGAFLFSGYLDRNYDIYLLQYFDLIVFYSIVLLLSNTIFGLLESYERFVSTSLINFFEPVSRLLLLLFLFFKGGFGVEEVFLVYILSKVISIIFGFISVRDILKRLISIFKFGEKRIFWPLMRKHGKWLSAREVVSSFLDDLTPWIIKIFLTTEMVAIYKVAQKIVTLVSGIFPIGKISFPLIANNIDNTYFVNVIVHKFRKYSTLIAIFFVLALFVSTDIIINSFFPEYHQSIILIKILSLRMIMDSAFIGQKGMMFALNMQKFQFQLFLYSVFQKNILKLVFIYYFALIGLALSGLIHVLFLLVAKEIYLMKNFKDYSFSFRNYLKFDDYDRMLIRLFTSRIKKKFNFITKKKI